MAQSDFAINRFLLWTAVATALFVVGALLYQYVNQGAEEGNLEYRTGNLRLEDGEYEAALREFNSALAIKPEFPGSLLGRGQALMGLGRDEEALDAFNRALEVDPQFAVGYANRGILLDRMGQYERAIADYRKALGLKPDLAEGPGWLTRFFRLQPQRPPTIADRVDFLQRELAKPPGERLLRVPELDAQQRSYKVQADK